MYQGMYIRMSYSSMIHNNPKPETIQKTINNLMDKWWYIHIIKWNTIQQ